jgi:hypothetical protein
LNTTELLTAQTCVVPFHDFFLDPLSASLAAAITDAIHEVVLFTETRDFSDPAAELRRLSEHIINTFFLFDLD